MRWKMMALFSGILLVACDPDILKQDQADVSIRIVDIVGISGHDDEEGDFINSDVTPAFNDNVTLTVQAYTKAPKDDGAISYFEWVTLEQYEVRYFRTDGLNVEGRDVPYRITGVLSQTIAPGEEAEVALIVVRHQAKFEPPLRNLRSIGSEPHPLGGGLEILSVMAQITVYGRTGGGDVVKATAGIHIQFADFANE